MNYIKIRGAGENNLKNIDIDIPKNKFVVLTGVSGSGKSSLAFDTIFKEGQRRYIESLSSYARQFLGKHSRPNVESIDGLCPAVAIDQKTTSRNPRSTVATLTEIYDYLRILYARAAESYCPKCKSKIEKQSIDDIVKHILNFKENTKILILAPIVYQQKGEFKDLFRSLRLKGFSKGLVDGQQIDFADAKGLNKNIKHDIYVIIDRIIAQKTNNAQRVSRINLSVETAAKLSAGKVDILDINSNKIYNFNQNYACPNGHKLNIIDIEPRSFSFNSPIGACDACQGLGITKTASEKTIIQDFEKSILQGAISPFSSKKDPLRPKYFDMLYKFCDQENIDMSTPWKDLDKNSRNNLLYGKDFIIQSIAKNRFGKEIIHSTGFEGIINYIERRYKSINPGGDYSQRYGQYLEDSVCKSCNGARLKPEYLSIYLENKNIYEITSFSAQDAYDFFKSLNLKGNKRKIAEPALKEIILRLKFLIDVGLDYLELSRSASTLSGGEAQRIRLASQIASSLSGVIYVLDEPSIGLHQKDNLMLINALKNLRDVGNSVLVVEHDLETIQNADWVIDIGKGAGIYGGRVIYSGDYGGLLKCNNSLTSNYLSGVKALPQKNIIRKPISFIKIKGANKNNLKNIDADIPTGVFCCISGPSGSGKSTLINHILYEAAKDSLLHKKSINNISGAQSIEIPPNIQKIIKVDQAPIGKTPRSNPATYIGVFDLIRSLFASLPLSKEMGFEAGRFSFNVAGGRCEECLGAGVVKIEMNFLPDVFVVCSSCNGKRYNAQTLKVEYRSKNIYDILEMQVDKAFEFFEPLTSIAKYFKILKDIGLGYIKVGQSALTLSGGESQRIRLAKELIKAESGSNLYILDEPSTGLHIADISNLLHILNSLVDKGNSVIVIEHNLDIIKQSDWVIDLGASGGSGGGQIMAQGTPKEVSCNKNSCTGRYL